MFHLLLTCVVALELMRLVGKEGFNFWCHCENCCEDFVGKYSNLLILSCGCGFNISVCLSSRACQGQEGVACVSWKRGMPDPEMSPETFKSLGRPAPAPCKHCLHVCSLELHVAAWHWGQFAFTLFSMTNTCGETVTNPLILIFLLLESCWFSMNHFYLIVLCRVNAH